MKDFSLSTKTEPSIPQVHLSHPLRALTEIKVPTPVVEWYSSNLHEKARS